MPWWLRHCHTAERLEGYGCPVLRLRPARPSKTVLQGDHDILQPDVEKVAAARQAGNDIEYQLVPKAFHVCVAAVTIAEARPDRDSIWQRNASPPRMASPLVLE